MKNKKAAKIIKIIAASLAGIIVLGAAGIFVTFNFVIKPKSKEIVKAVDEIIRDEDIKKAIEPYLSQSQLDDIIKSADGSKTVSEYNAENGKTDRGKEQDGSGNNTASNKDEKPDGKKSDNSAAVNNSGSNKTTSSGKGTGNSNTEKPKKKRSQYGSQYDYVKDNIPSSDFSRGMALVSRVDMGYVSGLMAGGLTPEEKSELKAYLTSRFSGSEIAEGLALYSKYSYLLR